MKTTKQRLRHNENARRWREKNRGRWLAIARKSRNKWRLNNIDREREAQREHRHRLRKEILAFFGEGCVQCGFKDWRALQVDHIHSDGSKERLARGGGSFNPWRFRKLLKTNSNESRQRYQVLCANCNWIKRYTHNENPNLDKRKNPQK